MGARGPGVSRKEQKTSEREDAALEEIKLLEDNPHEKLKLMTLSTLGSQRALDLATKTGLPPDGPGLFPPVEERWQDHVLQLNTPERELLVLDAEQAGISAAPSTTGCQVM